MENKYETGLENRPGNGLKLREYTQTLSKGLKEKDPIIQNAVASNNFFKGIHDFYDCEESTGTPHSLIDTLNKFGEKPLDESLLSCEEVNNAFTREDTRRGLISFGGIPLGVILSLSVVGSGVYFLPKIYENFDRFMGTNVSDYVSTGWNLAASIGLGIYTAWKSVELSTKSIMEHKDRHINEKSKLDDYARNANDALKNLRRDERRLNGLVGLHDSNQPLI